MAETTFEVVYAGPAVEDGRMPVRDLAPALFALGELVKLASEELYPDLPAPALEVKATERACFDVHLVLAADGTWDQLIDMLTARGPTALTNLLGLLIDGSVIGAGIFKFSQLVNNRRIKREEPADDPNRMRVILDDGTMLEAPAGTVRLYRNTSIRRAARDSVAPLKRSGIERLEFRPSQADHDTLTLNRTDAAAFDLPESADESVIDEERQMVVTLVSLSFSEGNKWRVSDGTNSFGISIDDEVFVDRVNRGEAFRKGDMLRCRIRVIQTTQAGQLRSEYRLTEVIDHIKAGQQLDMDDSSDDRPDPAPEH